MIISILILYQSLLFLIETKYINFLELIINNKNGCYSWIRGRVQTHEIQKSNIHLD